MKRKLAATCYVFCTLLTAVAVHAADSDSDRSHPMTFVKDSAITTKIKAKLTEEKMDSLIHISVDTDKDGIVWLSGTAKSQDQVDKAVSIAHDTEGVTAVKNNIKIK